MEDTILLLVLIVLLIILVLRDSSPSITTSKREIPKTIFGYRCEKCRLKVERETPDATCWDCDKTMTLLYIRTKL